MSKQRRKSSKNTQLTQNESDQPVPKNRGSLVIGGLLVFLFVIGAIADITGSWSGIQGIVQRLTQPQPTPTPLLREPSIPPKFGLLPLGKLAFYAPDTLGNNQIYIANIFGQNGQDIKQITTTKVSSPKPSG